MKAARSVAGEILALFVDDWPPTLVTVAWLGAGPLLLRAAPLADAVRAILFFCGFAAILIGSVAASARRRRG